MTIDELRMQLKEKQIPEHMYSLLSGGFPNEAYCLVQASKGWEVYYSERGKKRGTKFFSEEEDACEYLLKKLLAQQSKKSSGTP